MTRPPQWYSEPKVRAIRQHQVAAEDRKAEEREKPSKKPKPPKRPLHHAVIRDDGKGALSLLMGLSEQPAPDGLTRFACLTLNAGTTKEEAMALARAINERLASVEVIRW